jgi:uncharacterized phage-associated protein
MTVAKFIVKASRSPVSNLKLQKLLYYVQGWSLGIYEKPVFTAEIQAWAHGPVVPNVFLALRHLRWASVPIPTEAIPLEPHLENHVHMVLRAYGEFTAADLERLSHTEKPWLDARGNLPSDAPSRAIITNESMKEFFGSKVHGKTAQEA